MGIWRPDVPVESNRVLQLNRSNPFGWTYSLPAGRTFPDSTTAWLTIKNSYGQTLGIWAGVVSGGDITFDEDVVVSDAIPAGSSWTLIANYGGVQERMLSQGIITRHEAPFPDAPPQSTSYDGVRFKYSFTIPGYVTDPAWRIMNGKPKVYDNSSRAMPNAVASGGVLYDDSAMLYFAPLRTDSVTMTYNTIRSGANSDGHLWTVICSNYDMTEWVGFRHKQVWGIGSWDDDQIDIVTGTSPTTFDIRASVDADTIDNQHYVASYNELTNTYRLFLEGATEPIVEWEDTTNIVTHGPGYRHVGFGFRSDFLEAGVQVSDWFIADSVEPIPS